MSAVLAEHVASSVQTFCVQQPVVPLSAQALLHVVKPLANTVTYNAHVYVKACNHSEGGIMYSVWFR